jgi:hypothetical protein
MFRELAQLKYQWEQLLNDQLLQPDNYVLTVKQHHSKDIMDLLGEVSAAAQAAAEEIKYFMKTIKL